MILAFQHKACLADWLSGLSTRQVIILGGGLVLWIVGSIVHMFLTTPRHRRKAAERPHMSTEEFLDWIGAGSRYDGLCVAIRQVIAKQAKVPVEVIYPDDSMEFLISSLTYDGGDTVDIVMAIEDGLNISWIPDNIAEKVPFPEDSTSLADCIWGIIECKELMPLLAPEESVRDEQGK